MCKGPEVGICLEVWENNREALTRAEEGGGCGGRRGESYAEGGHSRPVGHSQDTGFVFSVTRNQQRALSGQRMQSKLHSNPSGLPGQKKAAGSQSGSRETSQEANARSWLGLGAGGRDRIQNVIQTGYTPVGDIVPCLSKRLLLKKGGGDKDTEPGPRKVAT